jgi:hypothetical protein
VQAGEILFVKRAAKPVEANRSYSPYAITFLFSGFDSCTAEALQSFVRKNGSDAETVCRNELQKWLAETVQMSVQVSVQMVCRKKAPMQIFVQMEVRTGSGSDRVMLHPVATAPGSDR